MGTGIGNKVEGNPGAAGKFTAAEFNTIVNTISAAMVNDNPTGLKDSIDASVVHIIKVDNTFKATNIKSSLGGNETLANLKGKVLLKADFDIPDDSSIPTISFTDLNKSLTPNDQYTLSKGIVYIYCDFDGNTFSIVEDNFTINKLSGLKIAGTNFNASKLTSGGVDYISIGMGTYSLLILDNITVINGTSYEAGSYINRNDVISKIMNVNDKPLVNAGNVTSASFKEVTLLETMKDDKGGSIGPGTGKKLTINGMSLLIANDVLYVEDANGNYSIMNNGTPNNVNLNDFIVNFVCTGDVKITYTGTSMTLNGNDYPSGAIMSAGTYTLEGKDITKAQFINDNFAYIHVERNSKQTDASYMFYSLGNMTSFTAKPDTFGACLDIGYAWNGCTSLTTFPLIDTSNATQMYDTWQNCSSLTSFPLIDTSNATTLGAAWYGCSSLTSFPLIDTSNATTIIYAWYGCSSLTSFPLIDVSKVTSISYSLYGCTSLLCMGGLKRPNNQAYASANYIFNGTPALLHPNATERNSIKAGNQWINPNAC